MVPGDKYALRLASLLIITVLVIASLLSSSASADRSGYFVVQVADEQTGRGVPLVELRLPNEGSYWTDSAGMAAMDEPSLRGREVNEYFARLDAVPLTDTERVIKRYFPLDDLLFALIGEADEIRDQVKKYAPRIEERKISQPGFK